MAQQELSQGVPELVRGDDLPLGVNLFWRLETLIRSGRLRPNERLPGVREFAAGAGVNVNTVRSVYRRLEEDGLAVSHHGLGTFVTPHAPLPRRWSGWRPRSPPRRSPWESTHVSWQGPSIRARHPRIPSPSRSRSLSMPLRGPTTEERAARAAFRAQIARLEAQLLVYPEASSGDSPGRAGALPRVADIAELEAIRGELLDRLRRAQAAAQKRSERHETARGWREDALAEPVRSSVGIGLEAGPR